VVSCSINEGCTNSTATNYDSEAEEDDSSCTFANTTDTTATGGTTTTTTTGSTTDTTTTNTANTGSTTDTTTTGGTTTGGTTTTNTWFSNNSEYTFASSPTDVKKAVSVKTNQYTQGGADVIKIDVVVNSTNFLTLVLPMPLTDGIYTVSNKTTWGPLDAGTVRMNLNNAVVAADWASGGTVEVTVVGNKMTATITDVISGSEVVSGFVIVNTDFI